MNRSIEVSLTACGFELERGRLHYNCISGAVSSYLVYSAWHARMEFGT
jgi:hypothetical protein